MQVSQRTITFFLVLYLIGVVTFMLVRNIAMTPDRFLVVLFFAALIIGRTKSFLRDWIPFVALIMAYEMLRGFATSTGYQIHISDMIDLEKSIFGFIPTVVLQQNFFDPNHLHIWDYGATLIDFLHFPMPLIIAFFLWVKNKHHYWRFIAALLFLSFAGFLTYLVFPAAPPWYASQKAHLIDVHKIIDTVVNQIGWRWNFSYYYNHLNPNPVAAMPSLHSAYPWLAFLALWRYRKKIGLFFLPYPILVWFSVVYLGEHYVIDVIAGIIYASASYFVIYHFATVKKWWKYLLTEPRVQGGDLISRGAVAEVKDEG